MDLCFFVGFFVALFRVNLLWQRDLPQGFAEFVMENSILVIDVVLMLGLIMLLTATVLGCMKYVLMLKKSDSYTTTVAPPQVVGSTVMVQSNVVQGNEPV